MIVTDEFPHPNPALNNHSIQFGISTWTKNSPPDEQTESIRRAVYNDDGIFSPHGSSEIPMEDMTLLIRSCIQRNKISIEDMANILSDISVSLRNRA